MIVVSVLCFFLGFSVFSSGDSGECQQWSSVCSAVEIVVPGECGVQCVQQWR